MACGNWVCVFVLTDGRVRAWGYVLVITIRALIEAARVAEVMIAQI